MSGNYPDPPGYRMAYDSDGSQGFVCPTTFLSVTSQMTNGELAGSNSEGPSFSLRNKGVVIIFPQLRDLDAAWCGSTGGGLISCATSANTTNGVDGTWSSYPLILRTPVDSKPSMRNEIVSSTALAIKAFRLAINDMSGSTSRGLHLYGEPSSPTGDRLEIWHPTLDQKISDNTGEWGDIPRLGTGSKTFRVKNISSVLTANSVRVAMEANNDSSPSQGGWRSLNIGGGPLSQVNVGNLAPGAISVVVTLSQTVPSNAQTSLWWARVFTEALTWS